MSRTMRLQEVDLYTGDNKWRYAEEKEEGLCIENSCNVVADTRNQYRSYCSSQGIVFVVR